jgi:hypothetical protein
MSVPKGKKFDHGFSTTKDGMSYRVIAQKLNQSGDNVNYGMAFFAMNSAMKKFVEPIGSFYNVKSSKNGRNLDDNSKHRIAKDPRFHSAIEELLCKSISSSKF